MNLSAFHSYDVRGVYPSEINEELAAAIAKAFAVHVGSKSVVLGRDDRFSSPLLHKAIVDALSSIGIDVYDIGLCSTPLLNYAATARKFSAGIMISASHNPKEYNALKLIKDGIQIHSPGDLDMVKDLVIKGLPFSLSIPQKGKVYTLDVLADYLRELSEQFDMVKDLKIVVDDENGMGSITAKPFFEKIGAKVIALNEKIDGTFPKHPANPAEEKNLDELRKKVLEIRADVGISFDGDADRSFLIDDKGEIIYPDILCAIIAGHELKGRVEKRVYYDLRFSKVVPEAVREERGTAIMMRVGNPFYKEKLKHEGGVFAAELSGHVMFQDHYCIDDGLYAALKCLKVMAIKQKKLSELAAKFKIYVSTPELNFKVSDADLVLQKVAASFRDGTSTDIDGVYIEYPDWWFNLRASNTEPMVRLRIEATTQKKLDAMKDKIIGIINS